MFSFQVSGHSPRKEQESGVRSWCKRPWMSAVYWLGSACFLRVSRTTNPGVAPPPPTHTHTWAGPSIKRMHQRPMWLGAFSQLSSVLPNDSHLCSVDIKTKQHTPSKAFPVWEIKDCDHLPFLGQFLRKLHLEPTVVTCLWKAERKVCFNKSFYLLLC